MAESLLEVERLSVTLEGTSVLRDVSLKLGAGEALAVIGPNGAGKTVLFRALLGLVEHSGTVRWREGVKIGYVPQRFQVERSAPLTVLEFFLLQSERFWRPEKAFLDHMDHELGLVGMNRGVLGQSLGSLSGGETQRLLIAWAMLKHPEVLLLDEPTAAVDVGFEETIYALLHRVQKERGTALMVISHDLSVVYRYAQTVLCLNKSVVCHGAPVDVLNPGAMAALYGEAGYYRHGHEAGE